MSCFNESTGFTGGGGWSGGSGASGGGAGFGGSGGDWDAPLQYLSGTTSGYKEDGRGTWVDNGKHNIRHSVEVLGDGSIQEHVVTKDKHTGERTYRSSTY